MHTRTALGLIAAGAGLMYVLDPRTGRRRRAIGRDKALKYARRSAQRAQALARQASDHARGLAAEALRADETWVDDRTLVARVRSELGRATSHPGSLRVDAVDGCVILAGPVLSHEADSVIAVVENTRGVCGVEDQLTRHETPGNVPGLQGH